MRRKKIKLILAFLVSATILFTFSSALAQNEKINKFNVEITINSDSSIMVTEKIAYDFGTQNRRGIYRDIPYRYETEKGIYKLDFRVQNVVDETGSKYRYETSTKGDYISIKIGVPNVYVTGENIYIITYEVGGALNYFDEHDELYWNATGNEWSVNIYNASVKISLPQNVKSEAIFSVTIIELSLFIVISTLNLFIFSFWANAELNVKRIVAETRKAKMSLIFFLLIFSNLIF